MSHIDELTMMMYTDGELAAEEAAAVDNHLQSCRRCRETYQLWIADRTFFEQTFACQASPLPPLNAFVQEQIDAICALHSRNKGRSFQALSWLAAVLLALVVFLAVLAQRWLFDLLDISWTFVHPYLLWVPPFWLRENAAVLGDYLIVGSVCSALLFLGLISVLVLTGIHRQARLAEATLEKEGQTS